MPSAASIGLGPQDAHRRRFLHEAWTGCGCKEAAAAEEALLARFVKSPYSLSRVPIDLPGLGLGRQYIATLEINPDAAGPAIVWAHGAGAGLGFGYLNYDALAQLGGLRRRVLAFDWLGQANSSRPRYPHSGWGRAQPDHLSAALAFFVESLEAWRAALGVEEMDLFGHSTGAYVCAHYALAHPHRVRHLVLHGPAGIGAHPQPKVPGQPRRLAGVLPALLGALWWGGHLNFGAIQKLGWVAREPGRRRFHRFQRSRRGNVEDEGELDLLFDYFWTSLCSQPASSDSWVNSFLVFKEGLTEDGSEHFGLYARRPLADESPERLATLPPILLLFGDRDWVWTPSVVRAADEALPRCTLRVIEHAQHHLYLDRPDEFHKLAAEALAGEGGCAAPGSASV